MRTFPSEFFDTIVALATPPGRSALALLRVSGPRALPIVRCVAPGLPEPIVDRSPRLADVADPTGRTVDRALVTYFPAPRSATGEDVVEISLHGSPVVAAGVLEAVCAAGARPARPGEFTERAFLLGKVDLVQAEAVRELIDARTPAAARASSRRLQGELSRELSAIRESLQRAAAEIAATIDFAEDVGEELPRETASRIESAARELRGLAAASSRGSLLVDGARVVLLGRPNAGKSTLFNAIAGADRAIVTEVAGTTRDTLHAPLDVAGVPVELVDTAGLRETHDPVESLGVGRARAAGAAADAILYVVDSAVGWSPEDASALAEIGAAGVPLTLVANKIDTVAESPRWPVDFRVLPLCGLDARAGDLLRAEIARLLDAGPPVETLSAIVGSARQRDAVRRAEASARAAAESLYAGEAPEFLAARVHETLDALADLFGETTAEDILRRVFSEFCIGK